MQFEWNARTQITMWFDNTEEEASLLRDYGMTSDVVTSNRLQSASIYIAVNICLFDFFMQETSTGAGFYAIIMALGQLYISSI